MVEVKKQKSRKIKSGIKKSSTRKEMINPKEKKSRSNLIVECRS